MASLSCLSVCNASADNSSVDQTGSGPSAPLVCSLPTSPADQSCTFSSSCFAECNSWNVTAQCAAISAVVGAVYNDSGCVPVLDLNGSISTPVSGTNLSVVTELLPTTVAFTQLHLSPSAPVLTWLGPVLADAVSSGQVLQVQLCAVDLNAEPVCATTSIGIDDTAPVMGWVKDDLPVDVAQHPFTLGSIDDVQYQVDQTELACTFAPATDPQVCPGPDRAACWFVTGGAAWWLCL